MITVKCELNDNSLYSLTDKEFIDSAGMNKVATGTYEGIGNVFNTSFKAIKRLLKNQAIIDNIKSFTRTVDGEEEDVVEFYHLLKAKGKL